MSILCTTKAGICTIEINRPEKKNAFTAAMYQEFTERLHAASNDSSTSVVLIRGQPSIFSAGNDLEDFQSVPPTDLESPVFRFMKALVACPKPVIAAVRGAGIGIGATLLLHCDLVFMAVDSTLILPFVSLGLVPEFASSFVLPKLLGHARAAECLFLGTPITAMTAVECGIANKALPVADVLPHAEQVAAKLSQAPLEAIRATKQLLRRWSAETTNQAIEIEARVFLERLRGSEWQTAIAAFLQRRGAKRT